MEQDNLRTAASGQIEGRCGSYHVKDLASTDCAYEGRSTVDIV